MLKPKVFKRADEWWAVRWPDDVGATPTTLIFATWPEALKDALYYWTCKAERWYVDGDQV